MIVDTHTHLWESSSQLGLCGDTERQRRYPAASKTSSTYNLHIASEAVDVSFLLGFRSKLLGVDIPNKFIADCSYQYKGSLMGFGSVDPNVDDIASEAEKIRSEYKLYGFVVSPGGQGFHPTSTSALPLYDYAGEHSMPIIIHNGSPFGTPAVEFTNPVLWSQVLRDYSDVNFVFTDMGWPWTDQTLMLLAEYENTFMDLAGLLQRRWVGYQALINASQMNVLDKVFLGSDFPSSGASAAIEAIYSINHLGSNSDLPTIPRQKLHGIVERNVVELLIADV